MFPLSTYLAFRMEIARFIKKTVLGIHFPQEYLCTGNESFEQPFEVILCDESGASIEDVSSTHLLLGYKPVLIGIKLSAKSYPEKSILKFTFHKNEIASIRLDKISSRIHDNDTFILYKGIYGKHTLIPGWQQFLNTVRERMRDKTSGNVALDGNLYEQVRIAYSVPRKISLVTVSNGTGYNLFPTDLHGSINQNDYVDSLRISGKAGMQVESAKRIIISDVDASFFRNAYALGKNHVKDLQAPENFPFTKNRSAKFNWLLPESCIQYRELELESMQDAGIHRLYFFKILYEQKLLANYQTLSHIHRYAAEWRNRNRIETEYLIR
jgi:hypothetical protein